MLKLHGFLLGLVLLVLMVGASIPARAQGNNELLILNDPQTSYPVGLHLEYLEDPGGNLTIEDVTQPEYAARFAPSREETPNFGYTNSFYWIRFQMRNETNSGDWRLAFSDARLGLIDYYYLPQDGTSWIYQQSGRFRPSTVREYVHPYFVFPLNLSTSNEGTVYLRLQSNLPVRFSLFLWPAALFEQTTHFLFLIMGLFYGVVLVMAVYNFMIFLFLKKLSYLYYFLFIAVIALNMACVDGTAYVYIFPNWAHKYTQIYTLSLGPIFGILFTRNFLELKQRSPWLDRTLVYLAVFAGVLLPFCFFHDFALNILASISLTYIPILAAFLAIAGALITWKRGLHTARYFLLGWIGLLLNFVFRNISALGFIPSTPAYDWTTYLSIVLMVVFLSLALADQINELRTEAAHATLALQESEMKYRTLVEHANDGIVVVQDGVIVFVNSHAEDIFGYRIEELLNTAFTKYIEEDELARIIDIYQRRVAGENVPAMHQLAIKHKNGSRMEVEVNSGITMYDGKSSLLVVVRDITERKFLQVQRESALKALNESERKYRTLVEMANDAIVVIQAENIKFANTRFGQMVGCELEQLQDTHFSNYLSEEQLPVIAEMYQRREALETPSIYETIIQRQDGSQMPVEFSASLTTYAGEMAVLVLVRDITERKKLEAELRQYSENLEESVTERTRELEQSRKQLAILNRSSQTINMSGLDREKVFMAIRASCAWLVPADVVAISLVDHASGEVEEVFLMDRNHRLSGKRYALEDFCIAEVLEGGVTVRENDFQTSPCWPGSPPDVRSGMAVQLRGSTEILGVLSVQSYRPNAYSEADQSALESFTAHVSITLENIRRYKQLERAAVIEERQRLAGELHDSVTQLLYSMAMMSSGWGVKASQDQLTDSALHFHQIEELSLQALKEMRMLLHQLHPPVLVAIGLLKALEDRLNKVERRLHMEAHLHVEGIFPRLSPLVEEEIYFIILEALNNSLRHARATVVRINIRTQGDQLQIVVEDDGRGYDPSQSTPGMGTSIMHSRAANIGARLKLDSQLGQRTRVELLVEIKPVERMKDYEQSGFIA